MHKAPVVAALVLALVLGPATPAFAQSEGVAAKSLWGVKSETGFQGYWWTGRAPWDAKPSGGGVRVAVIGSGADMDHPDLRGRLACGGCWRDFVGERPAPYDDNGHGTFTAGIIASSGHFQPNPFRYYWVTGARGMAPHATLLIAKAVDADGGTTDPRVAQAVRWALDPNGDGDGSDGAHIIHLSAGFTAKDGRTAEETEAAVRDAIARGVVVVAPAGDDGSDQVRSPGTVPGVIAVGAVHEGARMKESNRGPLVDVYAPGAVVATYPLALDTKDFAQDGYTGFLGTSVAAAVVTGSIALVMDVAPELRPGPDAGPERVAYVGALLASKGRPLGEDGVALDIGAALAAADRGPGTVYLPFFLVLALVVLFIGQLGWAVWRRARRVRDE